MDDALSQVFVAARKVADAAYEFYTPSVASDEKKPWLQDWRSESSGGINSHYYQTRQGLFLEDYYNFPGSIWTPWGKWHCWGSGSGIVPAVWTALEQFLDHLDLELFAPREETVMGAFGPIYAILSVDGISLPKPQLRETREESLSYEDANRQWKELVLLHQ